MEEKTIGKFITALRRAEGMTQKELAEKLNVSDKTVSRWERDEGAPDLSLIPVIAEIFGVTCDELLRGERRPPAERTVPVLEKLTRKGEKQRRRLLRLTLSQYRSRTCIAVGLSMMGLIAALIGNLAFLEAVMGFLVGAVFLVTALVCQIIFVNRTFLSVEEAELEETELSQFKRGVVRLAELSVGVTVAVAGFTFPLMLVDAYVGLSADNMLLFGVIGAALALLLYAVGLYFFNASLLKREVYTLNEAQAAVYYHNHRLKKRCAVALAALLALTMAAHAAVITLWGPGAIMQGTVFQDYESFVAYMEQDIPHKPNASFKGGTTAVEEPVAEPVGETAFYDENGNEISEDEARRRTLEDINGDVVCEYIARNETVCRVRYSPKDGTVLPITVSTYEQLRQAEAAESVRLVVFACIYVLEIIVVVGIYFRKRAR